MMSQDHPPVAVVTGAASGIGLELSKALAKQGHALILVTRSEASGANALAEVSRRNPKADHRVVAADLGERESIRAAVTKIHEIAPRIDLLINNAGVLGAKPSFNSAGEELHWAVNVLAPLYLANGLKGALAEGAPSVVVNVSSGSALRAGRLDIPELQRPTRFRKLFGSYSQSKLALSLATQELAASFTRDGIHMVSVDPGPNRTKMTGGAGMPGWLRIVRNIAFPPPTKGAAKVQAAAQIAKTGEVDGAFLVGGKPALLPRDPAIAALMSEMKASFAQS